MIFTESMIMTVSTKRRSPWKTFAVVLSVVLLAGGTVMGVTYCLRHGFGRSDVNGANVRIIDSQSIALDDNGRQKAEESRGGLLAVINEGGSILDKIQSEFTQEAVAAEPVGRYDELLGDPERMKAEKTYAMEASSPDRIALAFAGDILFDPNYAVMAKLLQHGGRIENGISEELLARMRGADIFMVNNEFTYSNGGAPTEGKQYTFRAAPESVSYLEDMGADVVSLANNHVYDYGESSLIDTLKTLEDKGIPYVGAGRNLEEAVRPVSFIVNDTKIAILSATQIERQDHPDTKGATESSAGTFRCWNPDRLIEEIALARQNSDYVIVYIHWGTENTTEIDWAQRDQAKMIAEAGADLIVGDHPHCLQPLAYVGDVPVIYSLGNFWFNSRQVDTCLLEVEFPAVSAAGVADMSGLEQADPADAEGQEQAAGTVAAEGSQQPAGGQPVRQKPVVRIVPAIQKDCYTSQLHDADEKRVIDYLNGISDSAYLDEDGIMHPKN